ncbi:MAG: YebC/PmpR family DNA-binding transcriptional regulator [Planctomycetes bacterium]|nr:YebC/PmpR family DNA-binding transcriptional regulator [Planctomycetota bacterium]NOG53370.1 YebC/PmpR family DNA-binding transcriptional regulator [Planctomycetota bacterium]
MAGHSKWANIKHRKARQDAVKGKQWSKCSKAIMAAAKSGPDPDQNLGLRYAIDEARAVNMPKDTIEKAIKKGSGELNDGEEFHEIRYEGYGPNGVAIMVDCLTDNLNRTAPEIRKIFERSGGNMGVSGSVSFGFTQRGLISLDLEQTTEDQLMELALDAGAEDIQQSEDGWEVYTDPTSLHAVRVALEAGGLVIGSCKMTMIPSTTVECGGSSADKIVRLMDAFEDHEDVQKVWANFDIPEEDMARLGG